MVVATVVRRATWPRSVISLATCQSFSAATAMNTDTAAVTAPSHVTVSTWFSSLLESYVLTLPKIPVCSVRTARSTATPRSAALSLTLTRTAVLAPTMLVSILSMPLLMLVAVVTGTTHPVVRRSLPVGKMDGSFGGFDRLWHRLRVH